MPDNYFSVMSQEIIVKQEDVESYYSIISYMFNTYRAAMKELTARLDILGDEFKFRYKRNPIHNVESRLKKPQSICEKLTRLGLPVTMESTMKNIFDVAGVRVVCSYVDDVYRISEILSKQDDLVVERIKDYIKEPKSNGYRSLHMIVKVPVHLSDGTKYVPVEIQLRTIAMDFWASLEHDLKYKPLQKGPDRDISGELLECSRIISDVEERMQKMSDLVNQ